MLRSRFSSRWVGGQSLWTGLALLMGLGALAACSAGSDAGRGSAPVSNDGDLIDDTPTTTPAGVPSSPDDPLVSDDGSPAGEPSTMDGTLVDGMSCNSKDVAFENIVPTVTILVDRSSSMFEQGYGDAPDRWSPLRDAVFALEPFAKDVAFSLVTYTSTVGNATCPISEHLDMVPATNNFAAIKAALPESAVARPMMKGETPTAEAIEEAVAMLASVTTNGPKYLLVITDGEPDTCSVPDPQCGQDRAIAAAQAAFQGGVQTFVIGISDDVKDDFLNGLAHAGQGLEVMPPPDNQLFCIQKEAELVGTPFDFNNWRDAAAATYAAAAGAYAEELFLKPDSLEALRSELAGIIQGVRSCAFEMDTGVRREQAHRGAVRIVNKDGTFQDLVHQTEWDLDPERNDVVVISGAACDAILDSEADLVSNVKIEFPCEVKIPPIK